MPNQHLVRFTPEMALRFKAAYDRAVLAGTEIFKFEGNEYLVSYAKYVLEYLRDRGVLT